MFPNDGGEAATPPYASAIPRNYAPPYIQIPRNARARPK